MADLTNEEFLAAIINRELKGAILVGAKVLTEEEGGCLDVPELVLVFQTKHDRGDVYVGVHRDEEGNGPGWLSFPRHYLDRQWAAQKEPA